MNKERFLHSLHSVEMTTGQKVVTRAVGSTVPTKGSSIYMKLEEIILATKKH